MNRHTLLRTKHVKRTSHIRAWIKDFICLQVFYPDNRGFSWQAKKDRKDRKTSENIVSKSCWARRNVTLERGWSPVSSLDILISWAPFWPADMLTVHAREWRDYSISLAVQTPGRLIAHTQQEFDTISSAVFLFYPFFVCQEKPLLSGYKFSWLWVYA